MQDKWPAYIAHDPFYNDNLTKEGIGDFFVETRLNYNKKAVML